MSERETSTNSQATVEENRQRAERKIFASMHLMAEAAKILKRSQQKIKRTKKVTHREISHP